jgi:alkanesulfonate monooxygenase SsuD/methylene tetrahydromethanopterin reductase-like flavin-dependent oxidoreductase (luciferase family)
MDVGLQIVRLSGDRLTVLARQAEDAGLDGVWLAGSGDNYLKAQTAVSASDSITVGTCIAPLLLASPAFHAVMAHSLERSSGGRFVLGTGSQTRGQLRRALGYDVSDPVGQAAAAITAIRVALTGGPDEPDGRPPVPIYYSGVGPYSLRTAGRVADGFLGHPVFTRRYIEEVAWPQLDAGLARSGRVRSQCCMVALAMTLVAEHAEEVPTLLRTARRNLAYYFTTRSYGPFLDRHGWGAQRRAIWELAADAGHDLRRFDFDALERCVTDDMIEQICLVGTAAEVRAAAEARYRGVADRVALYPIVDPVLTLGAAQDAEERAHRRAVAAFLASGNVVAEPAPC